MTITRLAAMPAIALLALAGCASTQSGSTAPRAGASYVSPGAMQQPQSNHGFQPLSMQEFEKLKKSVLFSREDVRYLRMSRDVLEPNLDELLDVWYGFVGSNDHLIYYFSDPETNQPNKRYLEAVRKRFKAWVLDTAEADFDQQWLNKQLELGLRHHRLKKNETDDVDAVEHIPFRYLVALHYPITTTMKPFLEKGDHSTEDVNGMYEAWRKAVLMTTILWSQPYIEPEDY